VDSLEITQGRAEQIIRELQPLAPDDQIAALAGQLRRRLAGDVERDVKVIRYVKRGYLWEVSCEWGIFQAEDLGDALSACADRFVRTEGW
jgi:hypothetical protein